MNFLIEASQFPKITWRHTKHDKFLKNAESVHWIITLDELDRFIFHEQVQFILNFDNNILVS